jgi:hypothetical protein
MRHVFLSVLLLSVACGSGESDVDPSEANPSPEPAQADAPAPIEGEFTLVVNGVDMSFSFFPRTRNFARNEMLFLRAMPTQGSDEGLTLEVQGFDIRGATLPVTLGVAPPEAASEDVQAPAEGEPEATPGEAGPEGPEVTFGYWRAGSPFEGPGSVVFESFEDGVLAGHADDVSIPGLGLANGHERLLTNIQFQVALPAD